MGQRLLGMLLALLVQAQDDPKPLGPEIAAALKKTALKGSFSFKGELKTEVDPDDVDEEPTVCSVSGGVGAASLVVAEIKGEGSVHELLKRGGKVAGRETWKGHPLDLVNAPSELLSLVDLERLSTLLKDAGPVKALPEEKAGDADCQVYEIPLPRTAIRSYHDDPDLAEEETKSVRRVLAKLYLRKTDGLVVRLDASVRRLYREDNPRGAGTKGVSSFSLTLGDFGQAEPAVPPGLEKLLQD